MTELGGVSTIGGVDRRAVIWSFVIALASITVHALWWGTALRVNVDAQSHLEAARDLADGSVSSMPNVAPGYPLLLLATGSLDGPSPALLVLQIVLHLATLWIALVLLNRFGVGWRWLLVLTALLVAPPLMEPVFNAATEVPAQFFLAAGTWLAVRWHDSRQWGWLLAAGTTFGLAALVRPSFQLVALALAVVAGASVWHRERSVRRLATAAAIAVVGSVVLVGGVTAHHQARFGYAALTPLTGWHLMTRTGAFLDDIPDSDASLRDSIVALRNSQMTTPGNTPTPNRMMWRHRAVVEQQTGLSPRALDQHLVGVNLRLIASHPVEYGQVVLGSVPGYLGPAATGRSFGGRRAVQAVVTLVHSGLAGAFLAQLWFVSAIPLIRRFGGQLRQRWAPGSPFAYGLCLAIATYTLVVSTMFDIGEPRYRSPTDPLLVVMLLAGVWLGTRSLRRVRGQPVDAPEGSRTPTPRP